MKESYQRIMVVSVIVLVGAAIVFGVRVLDRLERITQVAERCEAKLDGIIKAAAPVGRAAVKKGADALKEIDAEDLGKSATEGLKEIGWTAKKRLLEHLEKKAQDKVQEQEQDKAQPSSPPDPQ